MCELILAVCPHADTFEAFLMKKCEGELVSLLHQDDPAIHYGLTVK